MPVVEFALDPAALPALMRVAGMGRAGRASPVSIEWHDTVDGALAGDGLALVAEPGRWRLQRLRPEWAVAPATGVAEARTPAKLGQALPEGLARVAWLEGKRRSLTWAGEAGAVKLRLLDGRLGSRGRPPVCRVTLEGEAPAIGALGALLAEAVPLAVPRAGLAEQALAAAAGAAPEPRALGAPRVEGDPAVGDSLAAIAGHLLDVLLHWADRAPTATSPEAVHQMRVAIRRLRSALSVFRHAAPCPQLEGLAVALRDCAARLAAARDWDVFLDGTGARLAETFPGDPRCAAMLRAGARRRRAAYAALRTMLAGAEFRAMTVALALAVALRPWGGAEGATSDFARTILAKRAKRVRKDGKGIAELPVDALHELRKDCKKLRYASKFFSSLFPGKPTDRYVKRLAALQEELGLLNDGAATAGLMAQLGRAERGYAAGLVEGFSAAQSGRARRRIVAEWRRFKDAEAFWDR